MEILKDLQPTNVFSYFEQICNIPHVSFHTEGITEYLTDFAEEKGLAFSKDEAGNILIRKPASKGYEDSDTIILQGHMDMVGESLPGIKHDFENCPIELDANALKEGYIKAKGTTLGADNGIAVAMMLAVLSDDTLEHPAIEALFTNNEEVGLIGAAGLDAGMLKGKILLNLDSEEEGIFTDSCAGGVRCDISYNASARMHKDRFLRITITGLLGGHSGSDIDKGRASANQLMGRLLVLLNKKFSIGLAFVSGGNVDNAICKECEAQVYIQNEDDEAILGYIAKFKNEIKAEYGEYDPDIDIITEFFNDELSVVDEYDDMERIILLMSQMPYGIVYRNESGLREVVSSINPGVFKLSEGQIKLGFCVRSSHESTKKMLVTKLECLTSFIGGKCRKSGDYPGWRRNTDERLKEILTKAYKEVFDAEPVFTGVHAGLECGFFAAKMPKLAMISFGPMMENVHSGNERLSISSTQKTYRLLTEILKMYK